MTPKALRQIWGQLGGLAALLMWACAGSAYAQSSLRPFPITGYDLQESCVAAESTASQSAEGILINSVLAAQCWSQLDGFMSGVRLQNLRVREAGFTAPVGAACVPDTLDMIELRRIVVEFIRLHPSTRTQRAGVVLARAFETAYPCAAARAR